MKQHHIKPILCDDEVKPYLGSLRRAFPIVTFGKAANNGTLVCKRFYIMCLLAEVGTFRSSNTKTYSKMVSSKENIGNAEFNTSWKKKFSSWENL